MPVSKFTLKYFNKTISNVYSLSKYSPKALLGQVRCQHWDDEMEPPSPLAALQELVSRGQGVPHSHPWAQHSAPGLFKQFLFKKYE